MTKTLSLILAQFDATYNVVDALDECKSNIVSVTQTVRDIALNNAGVSMAVLSRGHIPIRDVLDDDFRSIEIAAQPEDISLFLEAQMAAHKVFSRM